MHNQQLGFAPIIPIAVKAIPAVASILTGKKKKKAAERAAQYEASAQQIMEGRAVMATDVMTEADKAFLRKVWPSIRVAASFDHPNWASLGYPAGPALTPAAKAAITHAWPSVRVAANFDDVNWQYHAVPNEIVASLLPLPELGYQQPLPTYAQPQPATPYLPQIPTQTYPAQPYPAQPYPAQQNVVQRGQPLTASMFPGLSTKTMIVLAALGAGALILFSRRD